MGHNFHGFRGWPNIHENKIRELGVLAVLSRDCGQHPRKFYPQIVFFGAIHENFPLYGNISVYKKGYLCYGDYVDKII